MTTTAIGERDREYTVGLSKGASAVEETRLLLGAWVPGEDDQLFLTRVRESGLLGRQTAQRTRDLVFRVFRYRLLRPSDQPARWLKHLLELTGDLQTFRELLFLYTARTEALLYDFTIERFWPACRAGELYLRLEDVQDFLRQGMENSRIPRSWTPSTQTKISRSVLGALRGFGLLHEPRPGQREIVQHKPTDFAVVYLAYDLHLASLSDAMVVEHPDWHLFGLDREQVLQRLDGLDQRAGLVIQRAGSVVRITWLHSTMDEVIHAYTG